MNEVIEKMQQRWDSGAPNYDASHVVNENDALWISEIGKLLGSANGRKLLDVGTGTGFIALKAARLGFHCTGIDMSEGMIAEARAHAEEAGTELELVKSYVELVPFPADSFDVVTNRSLMWTLLEPQRALAEWRRVLKPGGTLCCFCHISKERNMHNHYDQEIEDMLPLKNAPVESYVAEITAAGFEKVRAIPLPALPGMHGGQSGSGSWFAFTATA